MRQKNEHTMKTDGYDKRILALLQEDGRMTNQDLADRVGLSPSPCLRRVRTLEESGLIKGYRAVLDAEALGLRLTAIVRVSMDRHTQDRFAEFERVVRGMPQVTECLMITGDEADYLLKAVVADMDDYRVLLLDGITKIKGVTGVRSSFVLRTVEDRTALPLDGL